VAPSARNGIPSSDIGGFHRHKCQRRPNTARTPLDKVFYLRCHKLRKRSGWMLFGDSKPLPLRVVGWWPRQILRKPGNDVRPDAVCPLAAPVYD